MKAKNRRELKEPSHPTNINIKLAMMQIQRQE
jgi:hypothetical protein